MPRTLTRRLRQPGDPSPPSEWARVRTLQERAIRQGFDWPEVTAIVEKVQEELDELRAAVDSGCGTKEEFGDVLLVLGRLALALGVDPEDVLAAARRKFARRYRRYRQFLVALAPSAGAVDPELSQALWDRVKEEERGGSPGGRGS